MESNKSDKNKLEYLSFKADLKLGPFKILNEVGAGHFGSVFSCIHEETKEKVAIKQIKKSKLNNEKVLASEINIQKNLIHPNICRMYCVIENENYLFLINEFCSGGDILQKIIDDEKPFDEPTSCRIFQQIISGLEYLHKNFICHRDIKPENILISNIDDDNNINIKISDFGLSKSFKGDILLKTPCGSPAYAAPEVLKGKPYKGNKIDIWSSGIVLYIMLCGELPFDQENQKDLVYNIINGIYSVPNNLSKNCQDLIKKLLQVDPNKRINIHEIKNHPWIKQFNFNLMKSPGIFINEDILPVDTQIIKEMAGKHKNKIHEFIDDIIKNKHNSNTVSYYLRVNQKIKRGERSISNFSTDSELFLNYIENEISKKKYWSGDLDNRVKILEEEIYRSFFREKKSINPRNKLIESPSGDLDSNIDENSNNSSLPILKSMSLLNKDIRNFELNLKNIRNNMKNDNQKKNNKIKTIARSYSQSILDKKEGQKITESISKDNLSNIRHFKNDKYIKDIDIDENKKNNYQIMHLCDINYKGNDKEKDIQNNTNINSTNLKKKFIKHFIPKHISHIINNKENKIIKEENKNNYFEQFLKQNNDMEKINNNNNKNVEQNNINKKDNILRSKPRIIIKKINEETKQQIIEKKKLIKIKLPYIKDSKDLEKKKKIINNYNYKNENILNKKNNNNFLNLMTLNNILSKEISNHKFIKNKEENTPIKKHKKIKILLSSKSLNDNKIEEIKEIKENKKEELKEEENENNNNNYSFQTHTTVSKFEIVLKSLVNEIVILNKNENENEIYYNCQKINEKDEKINFNLKIIKKDDNLNIIEYKRINGNKNTFDEIFNIMKSVFGC